MGLFPGGWDKFFRPLSENCLDEQGETTAYNKWPTPDGNKNTQVVKLSKIGNFIKTNKRPDFLPLAIPEDISVRLRRVHSKPLVWWIGQIITYILKPQPQTQQFIDNKTTALGFTHPIVGIHVRRTDKLVNEAKSHGIEEYMDHVEKYYQELEKRKAVSVRRVFLATDEVGLLYEAKKKYPGYVFVSDNKISQSANVSLRWSEESLMGIIVDLHLLARSDFVVCTCSSNICRLVYEMIQHSHLDASKKLISVDRQYFWYGENTKAKGKTAKMPVYVGAENVHLDGV
ncbi:alpha-(1,6)-fucosyltransferase [Strongylocentrotus purpuratus]|uniref:GT23 domain-containing protein n=1 Tax=Strongylocentrotus purpuratus TaxID=7668 RepID=A0A7M7PAT1_STRPU|nr:alpha-(1,6)-fucosyltransferase [Strongylocentrotus purpuratus]XP_030848639.1 alpha-(1,6)-fucosyltransferase [Strongylocentrotus purpuratus]